MYTGSGLRLALEIGAHKRRAYGTKPTLEDELYKRAFWQVITLYSFNVILTCMLFRTLVWLDRTMSTAMGRPCGVQEEEYVDNEVSMCRG